MARTFEELKEWVLGHNSGMMQAGVYPAQLVFVHTDDLPELVQYFGLQDMGPVSGGRVYDYQGADFYCIFMLVRCGTGQEPASMAHEAYHAVNYLYQFYDIEHDTVNDEPTAYLISYILVWWCDFMVSNGWSFMEIPSEPTQTDSTENPDGQGAEDSPDSRGGVHSEREWCHGGGVSCVNHSFTPQIKHYSKEDLAAGVHRPEPDGGSSR